MAGVNKKEMSNSKRCVGVYMNLKNCGDAKNLTKNWQIYEQIYLFNIIFERNVGEGNFFEKRAGIVTPSVFFGTYLYDVLYHGSMAIVDALFSP